MIVTGLSRGQIFETRLAETCTGAASRCPRTVDRAVLEARKAYHRMDDAVARQLDVRDLLETMRCSSSIRFVDFYRYCERRSMRCSATCARTRRGCVRRTRAAPRTA